MASTTMFVSSISRLHYAAREADFEEQIHLKIGVLKVRINQKNVYV